MQNTKSCFAAVLLAGALAACAGSPTQESTGEYIDDSAITTKVKSAFIEDKVVKARDVQVETFRGVVQLSGFADNRTEIDRAVHIAHHVPGVKSVKNDILIKPSVK